MLLRSLIYAVILAAVMPIDLSAQSKLPRIDPIVQTVVSGGRWKSGNGAGSFRVVEIAEGFERVRYRVFIQWLEDTEDGVRIKLSRELGPLVPDQYSLTKPQLVYRGGKWHVDLQAATRPMEQADRALSFVVDAPGQVTLVQGP